MRHERLTQGGQKLHLRLQDVAAAGGDLHSFGQTADNFGDVAFARADLHDGGAKPPIFANEDIVRAAIELDCFGGNDQCVVVVPDADFACAVSMGSEQVGRAVVG